MTRGSGPNGATRNYSALQVWPLGLIILVVLAVGNGVVASRLPSPAPTSAAGSAPEARPAGMAPEQPGDAEPAEAAAPEPAPEAPLPETDDELAPPPPEDPSAPGGKRIPLVAPEPRQAAFSGLSTWVDLHDTGLSPEQQARRAAAAGVQRVFVQTARFNSPTDIHDPGRLGRLIETAHDLGLDVMTWYIPDFVDPERDLRRAKAAMAFETPRGDRPEAFGLDIEMESLGDVAERSRRLVTMSEQLRNWAGPDYPMAAIVLPPLQLDLRTSWWPGFPYQQIRPYYDVFIPMSYSSYRGTDLDTTLRWNLANIVELRRRAGDPNLPIHMAGGIADDLHNVGAYVDALEQGKVLGGGLYDLHTTPPGSWGPLQAVRSE